MVKTRHALLVVFAAAGLAAAAVRCSDPEGACDVPDPMICGENRCVDLLADPDNCGACGTTCTGGSCLSGFCVCGGRSCRRGDVCCDGACADLLTDRFHCGICGNDCPSGIACTGGVCLGEACPGGCPSGLACCGVTCVDMDTDRSNCGRCGEVCDSGEICESGACIVSACSPPCTLPERCCGEVCTDVAADPDNCGACGRRCLDDDPPLATDCRTDGMPPRTHCSCNGSPDKCRPEQRCCDNGCKTVTSDRDNCGDCGIICDPLLTNSCQAGECVCGDTGGPCPGGTACCPDSDGVRSCVDITDDIHNCGGCGNECDPRFTDSCTAGACICGTSPPCSRGLGICLSGDIGGQQRCCAGACQDVSDTNCADCGDVCDTALGSRCEAQTSPMFRPCNFLCSGATPSP
jgi:hypothetical protein